MSTALAPAIVARDASPFDRQLERCAAGLALVLIPLALHLLPLHRTLALCDRLPRQRRRRLHPSALAARTRRWLSHRRGPWAGGCLANALMLYGMLRQQGDPARLHIGVQRGEALLVAHAWVTLENAPIGEDPRAIAPYTALVTHGG